MYTVNNILLIKRGVLLFWALWFSIAVITNVTDGLKALAVLPEQWRFASGNYFLMAKVTALYHTPEWVVAVLFIGVMVWETVAAALFWRSFMNFAGIERQGQAELHTAFAVSLSLWGAFLIIDEIFIVYTIEQAHRELFGLELITLLFLKLVPE